jgi:hypothetical protein
MPRRAWGGRRRGALRCAPPLRPSAAQSIMVRPRWLVLRWTHMPLLLLQPVAALATAAEAAAFEAVWNSPTAGCQSCSDPADQLSHATISAYKITANPRMAFAGKEIVLLYRCGLWPQLRGQYGGGTPCWAVGADPSNCTYTPFSNITVRRNGGVPQAGDVQVHAAAAAESLAAAAPSGNFSGLGALAFSYPPLPPPCPR